MPQPDWTDAACQGHEDPDMWFAHEESPDTEAAIAVCDGCPIKDRCLDYALGRDLDGVWGGMTARDRYRMRRRLRVRLVEQVGTSRDLKPCGTWAAARRHQRAGEPMCGPCRAANADRQSSRRSA